PRSYSITRIPQLPVLLLLTYRPEYAPHWGGEAHVTWVILSRLNRKLSTQLADKVIGGKALPKEVLEQIVTKTDGVPLFVEELTKAVVEFGLLKDQGDQYALTGPLPALAIPSYRTASRHGLIGSPKCAMWRRSARASDASFLTICCRRYRHCHKPSFKQHWSNSRARS